MSNKNIDSIFSEALRDHKAKASPEAWKRVAKGLDAKRGKRAGRWKALLWLLFVATALSGASLAAWNYWQDTSAPSHTLVHQSTESTQSTEINQPNQSTTPNQPAETNQAAPIASEPALGAAAALPAASAAKTNTSPQITKASSGKQAQPIARPAKQPLAVPKKQAEDIGTRKENPLAMQAQAAPAAVALPIGTVATLMEQPLHLPKKRQYIRVEITIPYRENKAQSATEPKKGINWRRVAQSVFDD